MENKPVFLLPRDGMIAQMLSRPKLPEYDGNDSCATCWHCHATERKCISKTGLFCGVTHEPVHPVSDPCEHFKLNGYFQNQMQAQKGREVER